ncbi:TetR/AcrR family transcriptional regulator [Nakamurella flavida]|uniref:TetR/AcrR family transcriptional regulator n=1 Tax=Nakamurella flavida TaxID=363630 RepID=A0A938YND8_9ACTN|nr:TetR/AcrR family transcriptional regulator [Nakamurella flavida]MBM9476404.1 TetR/AcrR family transcriptional regulator [Nakamurella flavida]MDP9779495.1 AcrR family transcriptional regulator [Nakamurella flavida]
MPPPPLARDKVLDAFEHLLVEKGERAATMEAIAAQAGVSKGGLIYHFNSKDALVEGLDQRLRVRCEEDLELMKVAPEGQVGYFLRTSALADTPFDRTLVAATRLRSHAVAREGLVWVQRRWFDTLMEVVHDEDVARTVMLIGDGLYYNAASTALPDAGLGVGDIDGIVRLVEKLVGQSTAG